MSELNLNELTRLLEARLERIAELGAEKYQVMNALVGGRLSGEDRIIFGQPEALAQLAQLIAKRLLAFDQSVELVTTSDLEEAMVTEKPGDRQHFPNAQVAQEALAFVRRYILRVVTELLTIVAKPGLTVYEEYWRWAKTVSAVASERGISYKEALIGEPYDEITRRLLTREEFIRITKYWHRKMTDAELFINETARPLLRIIHPNQEEAIERYIVTDLRPKLTSNYDQIITYTAQYLQTEVARIYGDAPTE